MEGGEGWCSGLDEFPFPYRLGTLLMISDGPNPPLVLMLLSRPSGVVWVTPNGETFSSEDVRVLAEAYGSSSFGQKRSMAECGNPALGGKTDGEDPRRSAL